MFPKINLRTKIFQDQLEIEKKTLNDRIEELEKAQKDSQAEDQARQSLEMDKMAEELQAKTAELIEAQASVSRFSRINFINV